MQDVPTYTQCMFYDVLIVLYILILFVYICIYYISTSEIER